MSTHGSNRAVIFALVGNLLIAIIKFVVAFITGSAAMLAESIHSTAGSTIKGSAVFRAVSEYFALISFKIHTH